MTEHPLYLGLDLSPEYTQLSYYKLDEGVPESICHSDSKDTYLLPNIMFYTDKYKDGTGAKDESGWSVGAVAAGKRFKEDGVMVDRIYQKTIINEDTEIYGTSYKAKDLLVKMLLLHIREFTKQFESYEIRRLVVTIADADILYMTRVQRERFTDLMEYERVKDVYILRNKMLEHTRPNLRILHPLPRVNEIAYDVDENPKAYYFQQAQNGLYARQAILCDVLGITLDDVIEDAKK